MLTREPRRSFCPACNDWFMPDDVNPDRCPRCHALALEGSESAFSLPTLLFDSEAASSIAFTRDDLSHLVGGRLDVYRIDRTLGRGAMGQVFQAWHEHLQRQCALKVLLPQATQDRDFLLRFLQEGRSAAALMHPNIVTTHAIGSDDGFYFLEMEFVPGRSLQRLLHDEGRLDPLRATILCAQIAEGLSAAHRAGIVHRDLKLDNVLLTHQQIPKIGDFGLAKRLLKLGDGIQEDLAGTPNYMAPELFAGSQATPASDVYALGVCYYLLLTGKFPFVGATLPELIDAATHLPPPPVRKEFPGIPLEMAECLGLLLSKAPANRPRDGIEAAQLLNAVCGQARDLHSLLQQALEGMDGVACSRHGDGFRVELQLPDARRQTLFLEPSAHGVTERLLLIFSLCGPAEPRYFESALRLNAEIPHGSLAIREVDGAPMFVMVDSHLRSTVDPEEIRRSVLEVANRADHVERLLTGNDHH